MLTCIKSGTRAFINFKLHEKIAECLSTRQLVRMMLQNFTLVSIICLCVCVRTCMCDLVHLVMFTAKKFCLAMKTKLNKRKSTHI